MKSNNKNKIGRMVMIICSWLLIVLVIGYFIYYHGTKAVAKATYFGLRQDLVRYLNENDNNLPSDVDELSKWFSSNYGETNEYSSFIFDANFNKTNLVVPFEYMVITSKDPNWLVEVKQNLNEYIYQYLIIQTSNK